MGSKLQQDNIQELAKSCQVASESIEDVYTCSPIQEALMAASTEISNSYVLQMVSRLDEDVRLDEFKEAWQVTAHMNAILRTRIVQMADTSIVQVVIREDLEWNTSNSLKSYLKRDIELPIAFGDRLWRYGIVTTATNERFFIWTTHHAVCDGYSLAELLKCVGYRYKKLNPRCAPPFKHFIDYLQSVDQVKAKKYWIKSLRDSSSLPFPSSSGPDHRAIPSSNLSRHIHLRWPASAKGSKALILQAAWALLLSKHTGSSDVTFPSVSSGRATPLPGARQMTGPLLSMVPVTFKIVGSQTLGEFLQTAYMRYKEMAQFEHTGLSNIRRYLGQEGARICDFRNLLVIQPGQFTDMTAEAFKYLGMNILKEYWKFETHSYPLVTTLTYTPEGFHLQFDYDSRMLHCNEVKNLANQYEEIVRRLCTSSPTRTLSSISVLCPEDKTQIFAWNATTPIIQDKCLHQLVEDQAFRTPDARAIHSWNASLSYSQLHIESSTFALELIDAGIRPGTLVGACFEKSSWAVVAILAILKAGGVYVPLDPGHPRHRLRQVIEITGIEFAVTSDRLSGLLSGVCKQILLIDGLRVRSKASQSLQTGPRIPPSNTAYILFTSGSTGKPKGVVVQHSAICTSIIEQGKALRFNPSWRTLQFSAYTFDVSIAEIFTTLAFGGCVCIPSEDQRMNDLSGAIRDLNVNVALLTPTVANLISADDAPSLHTLILGGEAVTREQVDRWRGHVRIANGFGPTEASVYCSVNPDLLSSSVSNIGISVGGNNWIVEPHDHELLTPIGCVGELVVSGHSIAKEYFSNEIETNAAFISAPNWLSEAGHTSTRIYKTGDLVRYKHDGTLEFVGRKDTQIKIRGLRIELGEVESRLFEASKAPALLALAPKIGPCRDKLVAVICLAPNLRSDNLNSAFELDLDFVSGALDTRVMSMRAHLESTLPDYMVPNIWVFLSSLPVLSSGKIDRKDLMSWIERMSPETYKMCSRSPGPPLSNGTGIEILPGSMISDLREIWSQVLNIPIHDVGADTSFFSLGGDSISAIQIVTKCKNVGINISVKDILLSRTLSKLHVVASRVMTKSAAGVDAPNVRFGLSAIQRMFIAQNEAECNTAKYNQGLVVRMKTKVDVEIVRAGFDAIVEKHAMLRARFNKEDGTWRQFYSEYGQGSYRLEHHCCISEDEMTGLIEKGHSSINISKGPTFSVDIFESENDSSIFVTAHHLVVDLVSWRVIFQDLEDYLNTGSMAVSSLPFSAWSRALGQRFEKLPDALKTAEVESPIDNYKFWGLSPAENTFGNVDKISWTLDAEFTHTLLGQADSANRMEVTDLLIAAIVSSFQQTFVDKITPVVFVEGHGRESWSPDLDISSTVGWFTVMYPVSNFPSINRGLNTILQHIRRSRRYFLDRGLEYFNRQTLCFDDGFAHVPKEILLNYQGLYQQVENEDALFKLAEVEHSPISDNVKRNSLFEIEARVQNKRLEFSLAYNKISKRQNEIHAWAHEIKSMLVDVCQMSIHTAPQSIGDFIKFEDSHIQRFDAILREKLRGSHGVIEDVLPCSALQNHMLQTQFNDPLMFKVVWSIEIISRSRNSFDVRNLERAWEDTVRKHCILRRVFLVDFSDRDLLPIQVVLEDLEVGKIPPAETPHGKNFKRHILPHNLRLETTASGSVICHFEANHAIIDGFSLRLLMSDFIAAYQGKLFTSVASTPTSNTVVNNMTSSSNNSCKKLTEAIHGHCILLPLRKQPALICKSERFTVVSLPRFSATDLQSICNKHDFALSSLVDAAWAQTLSALTNQASVTFGYIFSTRTPNLPQVGGPMIEVLACCVENAGPEVQLVDVASRIQNQRVGVGNFKRGIYGDNSLRGFNTAVNFQKTESFGGNETLVGDLIIRELEYSDPWDFDVFVRVFSHEKGLDVRLEFNNTVFEVSDRSKIVWCFEGLLRGQHIK